MPEDAARIETVFEPGRRRHRVTGRVRIPALERDLAAIYEHPDFDPDAAALWDLREADITSVTHEDITRFVQHVARVWGESGTGRAALVVSSSLDFGISRVYEQMLSAWSRRGVRVFRELEAALTWLSEGDAPAED
jgi:hypothetical protein